MPIAEISIHDLARKLGKPEGFLREFQDEMWEIALDALLQSEKKMAKRSPVDTGLYANSWEV